MAIALASTEGLNLIVKNFKIYDLSNILFIILAKFFNFASANRKYEVNIETLFDLVFNGFNIELNLFFKHALVNSNDPFLIPFKYKNSVLLDYIEKNDKFNQITVPYNFDSFLLTESSDSNYFGFLRGLDTDIILYYLQCHQQDSLLLD